MKKNLFIAVIAVLSALVGEVSGQGGGGRGGPPVPARPKPAPPKIAAVKSRPAPAVDRLPQDLALMMKYFAGEFDNYFQVWEQQETKAAGDKFSHIHSLFAPVSAPAFGKHTFYVKQYSDGDPSKVYRQRLYSFALNRKEQAIELKIYTPPDEKAFLDAHKDPAKLAALTPETVKYAPGCDVYWKRDGENFRGYMKEGACKFFSQRSQKNIVITDTLLLTKDEIWINDQARDEQGGYVFGNRQNIPSKLKRVRWFTGWAAVRKENSEEYGPAFRFELHDQGQTVPVPQPDGSASKYSVQLAQLVFQGATKAPVLTLKIIENATGKTVSYTWANPEAERIGINLRWIQSGLTLKK
jgi:hypothetical protein